jgi:hypothetical protein
MSTAARQFSWYEVDEIFSCGFASKPKREKLLRAALFDGVPQHEASSPV